MDQWFCILFDDESEPTLYSVDYHMPGYEYITNDKPIVKSIMNMQIGDYNEDYKFKLINMKMHKEEKVQKESLLKTVVYPNDIQIKSLKKDLISILKQYNPLGFLHMTSLSNLDSIYNMGYISSRRHLVLMGIKFDSLANKDVLEKTPNMFKECARFYLSPNTPALRNFYGQRCILVCDYDILFAREGAMYLTSKIATRCYGFDYPILVNGKSKYWYNDGNTYINNIRNIIKKFDFDAIYNQSYVEGYRKDCKGAEFLCESCVFLRYIKKIIFRNNEERDWFEKQFNDWNVELIVDSQYFK